MRACFRNFQNTFQHYSNGYYEDLEEEDIPPFACFEGGKSDTCTFFYNAAVFYLLFTNGSP